MNTINKFIFNLIDARMCIDKVNKIIILKHWACIYKLTWWLSCGCIPRKINVHLVPSSFVPLSQLYDFVVIVCTHFESRYDLLLHFFCDQQCLYCKACRLSDCVAYKILMVCRIWLFTDHHPILNCVLWNRSWQITCPPNLLKVMIWNDLLHSMFLYIQATNLRLQI